MSADVKEAIASAVRDGKLLESTGKNISLLLQTASSDLYLHTIEELVAAGEWSELNDRFYRTLAFGTGGLRGRTIGKVITSSERGNAASTAPPQLPCVGTNAMNFFNISRATQGLVAYLHDWHRAEKISGHPKIIIAHDTRFFSRDFAQMAARVACENGVDACLFEGPRSTPELSFAVRSLQASAGIVVTASHNPPHDNGYKVYFADGAQVVEPHASGIIAKVNATKSETYAALPKDRQGTLTSLGENIDESYMNRLRTLVIDPQLIERAKSLRIIFTPIHGTGGVIVKPLLQALGFNFETVPEQDRFDGAFPTVKSPNPENAEALRMGMDLAEKTKADLVIATDPDCDRMGVAVRNANGAMELLTGNQIGSLMAFYRTQALFDRGVLTKENASHAVLIKTFVTTDLQKAIAGHFGIRCVETLTGFKYIGAKLEKYEQSIPVELRKNYRALDEAETRALRLKHSSFYVFGGEESYGYSGADFVRDKDANGAVVMFCEVAAYAKSRNQCIPELLDEIFATLGYFEEKNGSLVFEGAEGAAKIARLVESYANSPPSEMLGQKVIKITNFEKETIRDVEDDEIPKEKMSIFELDDRTRVAVRASGTEPKIKYYLFGQRRPDKASFPPAELAQAKAEVRQGLEQLWDWLQKDAHARLAA